MITPSTTATADPLTDEDLTMLAEAAFLRLDQEEAEDDLRRNALGMPNLNPQPPTLDQP